MSENTIQLPILEGYSNAYISFNRINGEPILELESSCDRKDMSYPIEPIALALYEAGYNLGEISMEF